MQCISVTILLLSSVSIAVCAGNKAEYLKHANLLKEYPCGDPQPRVFELEDIIDKDVLDKLESRGLKQWIKPAVTVLHRCESSGCCKDSYERCAVADEVPVTLTFAITAKFLEYHQETVKNHTSCVCKSMDQQIK